MRTTKNNEIKDIEDKNTYDNILKFGQFQLQTKSFWISLISILCLFLLSMICINYYFYNKIIDRVLTHEETIFKSTSK